MEKSKIILYLSYLVCGMSIAAFIWGYSNMENTVPIHQNASGVIDRFGPKKVLMLLPLISLIIVIAISYLMKKPESLNYPFEVNEFNKEVAYKKVKIILSGLALFIASIFLVLIMRSLKLFNLNFSFSFLLIYVLVLSILPILLIQYMRKS
jgi:hypothetical protein